MRTSRCARCKHLLGHDIAFQMRAFMAAVFLGPRHPDPAFRTDPPAELGIVRIAIFRLARIERACTHLADWPARAGAAPEDVRQWWTHVLTLHRRNRTLKKELKEAERALGEEPTEQNFAWLQDVQAQLSSLEGTEATIEGFGALSGRPSGGP